MGRKKDIHFPDSREVLAKMLNQAKGPLLLSKKIGVSKVTIHSWMNIYKIESKYF